MNKPLYRFQTPEPESKTLKMAPVLERAKKSVRMLRARQKVREMVRGFSKASADLVEHYWSK
jgi:hypothetical protein